MNIILTDIPDVLVLEPDVFPDDRGFFMETFNKRRFSEGIGRSLEFVQDNYSRSSRGVLRGLHYQIQNTQAKLVSVVVGEIFDVVVDLRKSSPTFGKWVGKIVSADNKRQVWIPEGFAHGFLVLSETADVLYKVTDYYTPQFERCLAWNDPQIGIEWPCDGVPVLSSRDRDAPLLAVAEVFP